MDASQVGNVVATPQHEASRKVRPPQSTVLANRQAGQPDGRVQQKVNRTAAMPCKGETVV